MSIEDLIVKAGRKIHNNFLPFYRDKIKKSDYFGNPILPAEIGNSEIEQLIETGKSCMVTRFGSTELFSLSNYFEIAELKKDSALDRISKKISGKSDTWREIVRSEMQLVSGFFPANDYNLNKFSELYLKVIPQIDILGVWYNYYEDIIVRDYCPNAKLVPLRSLEPYYYINPWSRALKNKKVLVIHPFKDSIEKQFLIKDKLFSDKYILPDFELLTIKSVQSNANVKPQYETWFDALDNMQNEILKKDFDIAIIGAGAYGLPLAAFVKGIGKQAIHMGGATQILFGIKGTRWDTIPEINKYYNEFWTRPSEQETPKDYKIVEGGSYW
jgi:hypothetical protein